MCEVYFSGFLDFPLYGCIGYMKLMCYENNYRMWNKLYNGSLALHTPNTPLFWTGLV